MSHNCHTSTASDMTLSRVLIIGAGLTGSLTAALLRRQLANIDVTIWEKSRGAGGRMATSRSPGTDGGRADTGAQYISATSQYYSSHSSFYQELFSSSVIVPFTGFIDGEKKQEGVRHFIAPDGISSVVKYFLNRSKADVLYETHCSEINLQENNGQESNWQCKDMNGKSSVFDSIIITIPIPQLLGLKGTIERLTQKNRYLLDTAQYSSRYALAMFFDAGVKVDLPWTAKYITGDSCVRFACLDNKKRGQDLSTGPTSLVLHTSVPFGIEHLESDRPEVESIVLEHAAKLFPDLPKPSATKCHKWRYSQVSKPVEGNPGCMLLSNHPLLIAGGDGFTHSNFDGCVESALAIVQNFVKSRI